MASQSNPNVYIQVRIIEETQKGQYNDALYYTPADFTSLPETTLTTAILERVDTWVQMVTNTPPPVTLTIEELEEQLVVLEETKVHVQEAIDVQIATQQDTEAPTVPEGLTASIEEQGVVLKWQPSVDNVALAGYVIYREGEEIAREASETYTDFGSEGGNYYVTAFDKNENYSERSQAVEAESGVGEMSI